VQVKTPDGIEDRELKVLGSQVKQALYTKMLDACRTLKTLKSKGKKIGRLKFKSRIVTLPLKQFGTTYRVQGQSIRVQGVGAWLRVSGLRQIPKDAEFADARLIQRSTGYYLKVTVWLPKKDRVKTGRAIGIDLGIKNQMTLFNGIELQFKIPVSDKIRQLQRAMSRSYCMNGRKHTQNWKKLHRRLEVACERERRKKDDIRNKLCGRLLRDFDYVAVQNDSIKGWQSGRYGKQIQESALGGITARLHASPATLRVDRFFPSTKLCPGCGSLNTVLLSDRVYACDCGYTKPRDWHSAGSILAEALSRSSIPVTEHSGYTKPVEPEVTTAMLEYFNSIPGVVANLQAMKQEAHEFTRG
jgi:transposase